jgi:hypothetical protein
VLRWYCNDYIFKLKISEFLFQQCNLTCPSNHDFDVHILIANGSLYFNGHGFAGLMSPLDLVK